MTSEAILTELRALPGAPDGLRERVRALPEPKPRVAWSFPHVGLRRSLLVLAPAVVVVALGAAAVDGLFAGRTAGQPVAVREGVQHGAAGDSLGKVTTPTFSVGHDARLRDGQGADAAVRRCNGAPAERDAAQQVPGLAAHSRSA